jgi:hypothetical protein
MRLFLSLNGYYCVRCSGGMNSSLWTDRSSDNIAKYTIWSIIKEVIELYGSEKYSRIVVDEIMRVITIRKDRKHHEGISFSKPII